MSSRCVVPERRARGFGPNLREAGVGRRKEGLGLELK